MTYPVELEVVNGFDPDEYDWQRHLKKALTDLQVKQRAIKLLEDYYEGNHPRVWLTDQIKRMFDEQLRQNMAENWCAPVVDQFLKRLEITGFTGPDTDDDTENELGNAAAKVAQLIWDDNDMNLEQTDLYRDVRVAGEGFLFVWRDGTEDGQDDSDEFEHGISITRNDPKYVWWPKEASRTRPSRVVKVWPDEDEGLWRATIYYDDVCVRLTSKVNTRQPMPTNPKSFFVDTEDSGGTHGFDQPPIIRFAIGRKRQSAIGAIASVQDKINKLEAGKMVAAEFAAYNQLFLLTRQKFTDGDAEMRPGTAMILDPGEEGSHPTSVHSIPYTPLENYDNSISEETDKLFTMACLPSHLRINPGSSPSGDAVEADDEPFIEAIKDMHRFLGASVVDLYDMLGIKIKPQWRNPSTANKKDEVTNVKTAVEAGMPLELALKKYANWSDEDIEALANRPMSAAEARDHARALGEGAALGSIDPEIAKQVTTRLLLGDQSSKDKADKAGA